jgi:Fe-S-cluster-containing dehydrogenase component
LEADVTRYGWLLDAKRCIECRACESACKQWNQVDTGVNVRYRRVRVQESGTFSAPTVVALSLACNHCEEATCVKACPLKAISRRDDGIVLIDQTRCAGCQLCAQFCPYGAPQFHAATMKMKKCTMCYDRIDAGMAPACATLCPTNALQWGKWEDISGQGTAQVPGFSDPSLTKPGIRFLSTTWKK